MSFLDESRVRVRARLEGYDDDWLPAQSALTREIRYTNLPSGEYRLHLQAANAAGTWSEPAVSPAVVVLTPFWMRGWFALLVIGFHKTHNISGGKSFGAVFLTYTLVCCLCGAFIGAIFAVVGASMAEAMDAIRQAQMQQMQNQ